VNSFSLIRFADILELNLNISLAWYTSKAVLCSEDGDVRYLRNKLYHRLKKIKIIRHFKNIVFSCISPNSVKLVRETLQPCRHSTSIILGPSFLHPLDFITVPLNESVIKLQHRPADKSASTLSENYNLVCQCAHRCRLNKQSVSF
jgi:hypothetical protein